jgi:hypothetical protein
MALEIDGAGVPDLLSLAGFEPARIAPDTWRVRFHGHAGTFPLLVRGGSQGVITFAIVPYLRSPRSVGRAGPLYQRLLELNHRMLLAKFCIDDDLDVVLSAEWPVADMDRSEFADAIDVVTYYADRFFGELEPLAAAS